MGYRVEVWFATTGGYWVVGSYVNESVAAHEASYYRSDSRGVRIMRPDGSINQVKPESRL